MAKSSEASRLAPSTDSKEDLVTAPERPVLSIVIPIFNEEENVPILAAEIR